jgi:hypothetical protein
VKSLQLLAPAISYPLFKETLAPLIDKQFIKQTRIYNLSETLELDDHVGRVYQKSLLYLVSNAFESKANMPLLGMQVFNAPEKGISFIYSDGVEGTASAARTHGGFDGDVDTMNSVLHTILNKPASFEFTKAILDY